MLAARAVAGVIPQGSIARKYGVVTLISAAILLFVFAVLMGSTHRRLRVDVLPPSFPTRRARVANRPAESVAPKALLVSTPASGDWDWSSCRVAPPLVEGEEPLLVFTSVFVGQNCVNVGSKEVIPATHFTADRIPALFRLVRLWTTPRKGRLRHSGCISASFGASDPSHLAELRTAVEDSPTLAAFLLLHVVVGPQTPYPFNVHRNAALEPWNSAWLEREPLAWVKKAEGGPLQKGGTGGGGSGGGVALGQPQPGAPSGSVPSAATAVASGRTAPTPEYFAAAQTRVRYPGGEWWLADEGPPPPALRPGNFWPATCSGVAGGHGNLPPDFAAAEAAARRPSPSPSPVPETVDGSAALLDGSTPAQDAEGAGSTGLTLASSAAAVGDGSLPQPWLMTMDVDALPSGSTDDFADAVASALKFVDSATQGSTAEVVPVDSGSDAKGPPCIAGTTPAFAVLAFGPRPGGAKAEELANKVIGGFTSPQLRAKAADPKVMKHWLNEALSDGRAVLFFDHYRRAYQGAVDITRWLLHRMPASAPVRYAPLFEPYFIARAPVPPFDEFYRGRGHSKTSWFVPSVRCGRLSLHVLGSAFLLSDPRQDDYRGKDGRIAEGAADGKRKDRPENTAHMEAFTARLGSEWSCVQPGSGSTAYSPDAECFFTKHPDAAMIGRGSDRPPSLSSKAIQQSAAAALRAWPEPSRGPKAKRS